ncbi:MAG: glycosyltransferase family 1 protein [Chitinophagaceae bacterium]
MIRIVFDSERMKYTNTGLFHYCINLGKHLKDCLDPSHEEMVFFSPDNVKGIFGANVSYLRQNSLRKFCMPSLNDFDIWHCTYQNSDYVPKRNRRIKVVLSIHDLNFLYHTKSESRKAKYLRHLQENINRSDAIICISEFCQKDVLTHCNTGNKPVHVIHNGTNSLTTPGLYSYSYQPERPFLFALGVICRKKNFHVLLPLLEQNQDLELLIAGRPDDTTYLHYIHHSAKKLNVEKNLHVLGNISEMEKSWYYQNCYAFALPSLSEGFGLPVAEAMSVGKPVFLSDRTSLPEIGSNMAFYFRDFNAGQMQKVFTQGMQQYEETNMSDAIKQRSTSFCWNKSAKEYLNVYRSLY